jgi:hypothetical protein
VVSHFLDQFKNKRETCKHTKSKLNLETEIKQHYVLVSYIASECYAPISKISICLTLSIEERNETLTKKCLLGL